MDRPPGLIGVTADGNVESTSPAAAARLEAVDDPSAVPGAVAEAVGAFKGGDALAHVTLPAGEESSITLHASTGADGGLAIVVEEDRLVSLDPRISDSYGFTEDEVEMLIFYAQGRTTRGIAQILEIDAFTIQDYLMSMFKKTGTQNRADFLATIWASHFEERFVTGAPPSPYGFFIRTRADDRPAAREPGSATAAGPVPRLISNGTEQRPRSRQEADAGPRPQPARASPRFASSAATTSSSSTTRTSTCCAGSSATGPRSRPAAPPAPASSTSATWPWPSRRPARWRSSPTPSARSATRPAGVRVGWRGPRSSALGPGRHPRSRCRRRGRGDRGGLRRRAGHRGHLRRPGAVTAARR